MLSIWIVLGYIVGIVLTLVCNPYANGQNEDAMKGYFMAMTWLISVPAYILWQVCYRTNTVNGEYTDIESQSDVESQYQPPSN